MKQLRHKSSTSRARAVSLAAIRRYARKVAKRVHPDKIILFGDR